MKRYLFSKQKASYFANRGITTCRKCGKSLQVGQQIVTKRTPHVQVYHEFCFERLYKEAS